MPSTYTSLGTELMITGEKSGQWGTITNTNLQILEQIASGYVSQALTDGGTLALTKNSGTTGATLATRVWKLTGALTGSGTIVTVPDGGLFIMRQQVLMQYKLKQLLEQDLVFLLQIKDIKFYIPMGQMWWMS